MTDSPDPTTDGAAGDDHGEESPVIRKLREQNKSLAGENEALRRTVVDRFASDAGLDLSNPLHQRAWGSYDGAPTQDAVNAFVAELGITPKSPTPRADADPATPQPAQPSEAEQNYLEAGVSPELARELAGIDAAMAGDGDAGGVQPTLKDRINSAKSPEEILSLLDPELVDWGN